MKQQLSSMASELARKAESLGMPMPSLDEAVAASRPPRWTSSSSDLNVADRDLEKDGGPGAADGAIAATGAKARKGSGGATQNGEAQAAAGHAATHAGSDEEHPLTPGAAGPAAGGASRSVKPGNNMEGNGEKLAKALKQSKAGSPQPGNRWPRPRRSWRI